MMPALLKTVLSLSLSGSLLIVILLLGKRFLQNRLGRQWQYYIWLLVIARLLLPIGPNLPARAWQTAVHTITAAQTAQPASPAPPQAPVSQEDHTTPATPTDPVGQPKGPDILTCASFLWLAAAIGLLLRKIYLYRGFVRCIRDGAVPVSDPALLAQLDAATAEAGVTRPVSLLLNPAVPSPMLLTLFHPCIVLPDTQTEDLRFTLLHELTHCRRLDLLYKWLVQLTLCLHWFNPLVYRMNREIGTACEFSCDEAVLTCLDGAHRAAYGKALLDAMAATQHRSAALFLNGNKDILKERLVAIMSFQKKTIFTRLLTAALTLCLLAGAACLGVSPAAAWFAPGWMNKSPLSSLMGKSLSNTEAARYYEAGSLPQFQLSLSQMGEEERTAWLEKLYEDDNIHFFSVAMDLEGTDSPAAVRLAQRAYKDEELAMFSIITNHFSSDMLEIWLDKALADGYWSFQSILLDRLNRTDDKDALEEALAQRQMEEYAAHNVTLEGKCYLYQGQTVRIFLDIRPNRSFYTLDVNPEGKVDIRIVRDEDGTIQSVAYLTPEQAASLLEDLAEDEDDKDDWDTCALPPPAGATETVPIAFKKVKANQTLWLGEYTLTPGNRVWYTLSAETGGAVQIGFAKPGDTDLNVTYCTITNRRVDDMLLFSADITVSSLIEPGTYRLFLRAPEDALGYVAGSVSFLPPA